MFLLPPCRALPLARYPFGPELIISAQVAHDFSIANDIIR